MHMLICDVNVILIQTYTLCYLIIARHRANNMQKKYCKMQETTTLVRLSEMSLRLLCSFCIQAVILLCITWLHISTLAIAGATSTTTSGGNETDHVALLDFKSKILHDPQGVVSSWNHSFHFCEWEGVTCGRRHRRVTVIDLPSRGLIGSLSPYVGNLSFLRIMRLSNNTLGGEIPPEIGRLFRLQRLSLGNNSLEGEIPANISRCSNLIFLGLGPNSLGGEIPKEISFLSKLIVLNIHENNLIGGIPPFIGNVTSLEIISAASNPFGGSIPDELGQLKNLSELALGGNKLSGMIPPSIYNLSFLTVLSLAENQLHGSLPPGLGLMLPHIQILQLFDNKFTGRLPLSLSNASELEWLEITNNSFEGKIAINFGGLKHLSYLTLDENNFGSGEPDEMKFLASLINCSNLEVIDLSVNQLRGVIPNYMSNLSTQLSLFGLTANYIYGSIPSTICNLVNLTDLFLNSNQFTGSIPNDIGHLEKLHRLSLSHNRLSGKIPHSMGNLSLLNELYLENNKLQGIIPSSLGSCQNLLLLYLSQNKLSGTIPKELFGVLALSISLNLAQNHLSGSLPIDVGNLKNLGELDVSENYLSGEIPSSLGSCTSLENLLLEGNFFQGAIPPSLSSLRGILNFDVSHNNLSGQIPEFLAHFSMKNLNLSFNDFEGEVPMKGVFTNASAISVVGNNRLCGGMPDLQLPRCIIKHSKKQKMSLALIIVISTMCTLLGVTMVSTFLFCWLRKERKAQPSKSLLKESFLKVSYETLLKATDGFSSTKLIGVGSFSSVYKGILDQDETVVAVKVLNLQQRGASKSFMAECEALRNIRHRNLVKIITSCSSVDFQGNEFKALVYEFMPNGSLEKWLHSSPETDNGQDELQRLSLLQRINIAVDVACALEYLHHQCQTPIIHCDLKPSNVLLDHDMIAHVGDFGLARFRPELTNPRESSSIGIRGTIGYAAPEYGLGSETSTHGDVYSYGILLLEMMTGKSPTDSMFVEGLNLHNFARMALPDHVVEIVGPMLQNNDNEEEIVVANNNNRRPRQARNGSRTECLISVVKIGVACSMESPQDRMNISNVVHELQSIRDIILQICRTKT